MDKNHKKRSRTEFLNIKPLMGVLTICNKKYNKIYVSGNINLVALSNKIKFGLKSGQFENKNLQEDWDVLGSENFVFENAVVIPVEENKVINYKKMVLEAENDLKIKLQKIMELY